MTPLSLSTDWVVGARRRPRIRPIRRSPSKSWTKPNVRAGRQHPAEGFPARRALDFLRPDRDGCAYSQNRRTWKSSAGIKSDAPAAFGNSQRFHNFQVAPPLLAAGDPGLRQHLDDGCAEPSRIGNRAHPVRYTRCPRRKIEAASTCSVVESARPFHSGLVA